MNLFIVIILSYLVGAIPFSFILAKVFKNVDLRKVGSGNIGATNLARVVGYKIGIIGLLLDILKGVIPVVYFAGLAKFNLSVSIDTLRLILGLVSICGHNWTIFLKFRGGKGVATSVGVLIGLAIKNTLIAKAILVLAVIWVGTFLISGYVSLASLLSAFFLPIFLYIFRLRADLICLSVVMSLFVIFRHNSNIIRLLQHKENRFNLKSKLFSLTKKALP
jgi:glycerol-3-phosphate acyltransferase PlsY